jgi:hypothetical protein
MKLPTFIDLNPTLKDPGGYTATNEDIEIHKRLLARISGRLATVASIASGGEVPLLCLLPKCDSIIAIDHSYRAIISCYIRLILLQTVGARQLTEWLAELDVHGTQPWTTPYQNLYKKFLERIEFTRHYLPDGLKGKVGTFDFSSKSLRAIDSEGLFGLRRWWKLTEEQANFIIDIMMKVTFVHGDFLDLKNKYPPFDLLYISNMLGHVREVKIGDRNWTSAKLMLKALVKPGGYILGTDYYSMDQDERMKSDWRNLDSERFKKDHNYIQAPADLQSGGWTHTLHQRLEEVTSAEA